MYLCADIFKSTFSKHHTAEPAFRTQEVGCAVGIPRLVNSTLLWRETREGVVNRHNRLTEWDLITSHGSTLNKRARSIARSRCRWMRYCQDLLSRDMVAGAYEHQFPDEDLHPYVCSQMKNRCSEYK